MLTRSTRWVLICTIATALSSLLPLPIAQAEQAELTDTEPPCYVIYGSGDQENLTNLCGMGRAPVALPAAAIAPIPTTSFISPESNSNNTSVPVTTCQLQPTPSDDSTVVSTAFIVGQVENLPDVNMASNLQIYYEVTGPNGQRIHNHNLPITRSDMAFTGEFSGNSTDLVRVELAPRPLFARVTRIAWQNPQKQLESINLSVNCNVLHPLNIRAMP